MNSASFRVEDESSPYAFKSEPVEADRKLSFRGVPNLGNKNETKTVSLTPRVNLPTKCKKEKMLFGFF